MAVDNSTMKPLKKLERAGVNYQNKRGMNFEETIKYNALSESELIQLFSSNDFLFLLFYGVAEGSLLFPKSREKMGKLYQANRVNCYELSKQKKYYDWCKKYVEQKTIAFDVQINRIISVLMLAHEQKDLRTEVIEALLEAIPLLRPVLTNPISNYPINEITDEYIKNFRFDSLAEHKKVSALIDFGNYIVLYRLLSEEKDVKKANCAYYQPLYINHIDRQHTVRFCVSRHSAANKSDATDIIRKATTQGSQNLNEFVKLLSGGDVLYEACRWYVNSTIKSENAYSLLVHLQENGKIFDKENYHYCSLNGKHFLIILLQQLLLRY